MGCAFGIVAFALASCSGERHPAQLGGEAGTSGSNAKVSASAGRGENASRDGSTGSMLAESATPKPAKVSCGSAQCAPAGALAPCCVDAASSTCGVEDESVGIACGLPAVADPRCPPVNVDFAGQALAFDGCCTVDGLCGGFNLGSPCTLVTSRDEDGGIDPGAPRRCN